jgi:hypothetical protein
LVSLLNLDKDVPEARNEPTGGLAKQVLGSAAAADDLAVQMAINSFIRDRFSQRSRTLVDHLRR